MGFSWAFKALKILLHYSKYRNYSKGCEMYKTKHLQQYLDTAPRASATKCIAFCNILGLLH